ncbi:MAG TPA: cyclic peptide export ABC transporter [Candidatus Binatia bacterium]
MKLFKDIGRVVRFLAHVANEIGYSWGLVVLVIALGFISGLCNAALIALINTGLAKLQSTPRSLVWAFAGLCILLPVTRFFSNALLIRLSARSMLDLRLQLCRRILQAPLPVLEKLGKHKLLASLTEDVITITNTLTTLPLLCMHIAIVVSSFVYLAWLSWTLFIGVVFFVALAVVAYQLPAIKATQNFRKVREEFDALTKHFRAVTDGTKELKLHYNRREAFFSKLLQPTLKSLERHDVAGNTLFEAASSWGHILFFVLIGLLLFAWPNFAATTTETLTGYVLTLLYIITPLQVVLGRLPALSRTSIALKRIEKLGFSLTEHSRREGPIAPSEAPPTWQTLELAGVTHSYHLEKENRSFTMGPIDLSISRGELIFVTGGNGSGKTTLAKVLTGLYIPESGEIRLDGKPITDENRERYRQLFSVVFAEIFLFESLLGLDSPEIDSRASEYLMKLELDHKVEVKDGALSTVDLSQGQRKRLSLLTAYLEDRPIYIFDEWAADQDPVFKDVFYYQILLELKSRGKTVIVISHDDRYYGIADRIVKLDYGKIETSKDLPSAAEVLPGVPVFS